MKILSLFDGMACGYEALQRAGIPVEKYYASEIDKYAIQIAKKNHPDIIEIGDVCNVRGEDYQDIDLLIGGSPCFVKGTKVWTYDGYKDISEVEVGDYVLGLNGEYNQVLKTGGESKEIWSIKGQGFLETFTTENHPYYVAKCKRIGHHPHRELQEPERKEVKDIEAGDYVGLPIIHDSKNIKGITKQEAWLLGRYMADGHFRHDYRKGATRRCYQVIYSIGDNKLGDFDHITEYHITKYKHTQSCHRFVISSKRLVELCEDIGHGAINKFIPKWILDLPRELLIEFFKGYVSGDGHYKGKGVWRCSTISRNMAMSLCLLSATLFHTGAQISFIKRPEKHIIEGREVNQNNYYIIEIREYKKPQDHYIYTTDYIWFPVKEVKNLGYEDMVYNLEVENTNSYTANNIIVHNCQGFSVAGKQLNFEDPRSKLFFEFVRLLKEVKPKYFLLENVKMKKEWQDVISRELGVEPIEINSSLVSAQNRRRLYRTNIPGITQPKDKGILLKDILEESVDEKYYYSAERWNRILAGKYNIVKVLEESGKKCHTLTAVGGGNHEKKIAVSYAPRSREFRQQGWKTDKSPTICARDYKDPKVVKLPCATQLGNSENFGNYYGSDKGYTLRASNPNGVIAANDIIEGYRIRKLTPMECERLQTLPDNYTGYYNKDIQVKNIKSLLTNKRIEGLNVVLNDATENQNGNKCVLCIREDLTNTEAQNCQLSHPIGMQNVNIVIEKLEKNDEVQDECVIDITKTDLDIEMLSTLIKLRQKDEDEKLTDTIEIVIEDTNISELWKITFEGNGISENLPIILTLLKRIIQFRIFTYVKIGLNTTISIGSWRKLQQNYIESELLLSKMVSIESMSDTQRYKMLGNGWTVEVIRHIFSFIKN